MILTDFTENAGRVAVPSGGVETVGILSDFEILNLSTLSRMLYVCVCTSFQQMLPQDIVVIASHGYILSTHTSQRFDLRLKGLTCAV